MIDSSLTTELDSQALLSAASAATGLDDFGDDRFQEGMRRFLESAAAEGRLSPGGVTGLKMNTLRLLINRLRFEEDLKKHPEILEEDVSDPVVIIGLPRTGTTKIQRLMSRDPGVQGMWFWRLLDPVPAPGWSPGQPDPRLEVAEGFVDALLQQFPDWMEGHPQYADEVDEEAFLMEMSFEAQVMIQRVNVPSFRQWWLAQPRDHPYDYLRTMVQYLQWQDGGRQDRPFVMKSPVHLGNLDQLARIFPNCTIVQTHRHPTVAIPSTARLCESLLRMASEEVDLEEVGASTLRFQAGEMARNLAQRAALGDTVNILDVQFGEIVPDPLGVVRSVYQAWDRPLTTEAEAAMRRWLDQDEHSKSHSYSLERYGLTESQIEAAFAEYIGRFFSAR